MADLDRQAIRERAKALRRTGTVGLPAGWVLALLDALEAAERENERLREKMTRTRADLWEPGA